MLLLDICCSGNMELSEKCFQELILKDQNHPAALINYAAFLLCKYGSTVVGMCLRWFVCLLENLLMKRTLLSFSLLFCKYLEWVRSSPFSFPFFGLLIRTLISLCFPIHKKYSFF